MFWPQAETFQGLKSQIFRGESMISYAGVLTSTSDGVAGDYRLLSASPTRVKFRKLVKHIWKAPQQLMSSKVRQSADAPAAWVPDRLRLLTRSGILVSRVIGRILK
jgi:hypothetical protein